jgi:hypothetical protein
MITTDMLAYEFYRKDEKESAHLVGILPERRKGTERIDQRSIINWIKTLLGDDIDLHKVFFVKVVLKNSGQILESDPIWGAQET